ncbi:hypothetical protein BGX27_008548, partial [Mortierella sp. AM989]
MPPSHTSGLSRVFEFLAKSSLHLYFRFQVAILIPKFNISTRIKIPPATHCNMSVAKPGPSQQVFRAVYKNNETGSITPLSMSARIVSKFDKKSEEYVILWNDIEMAFKNPLQVWHESMLVPYLTDENLE